MKSVLKKVLPFIWVVFIGCPYSAPVPLAPPADKDMSGMFGRWYIQNDEEYPAYFDIGLWNDEGPEISMTKYSYDTDVETYTQDTQYRGWTTEIGNTTFLNVEDVTNTGTFYFYKLEVINFSKFSLYEVTDNIDEQFTSSGEMYNFFKKYKALSFFYNNGEETYGKEKKVLSE